MGYIGLNIFIIVPRVVPHVSHVFCVLLKELCVGDIQPMLFFLHAKGVPFQILTSNVPVVVLIGP